MTTPGKRSKRPKKPPPLPTDPLELAAPSVAQKPYKPSSMKLGKGDVSKWPTPKEKS